MLSYLNIPYWRLGGFYFFYFALSGALTPFLSLYLTDIGFSAYAIGWVHAILFATKIIAPNLWGALANRTGKRLAVVCAGCVLSLLCFSLLFWGKSVLWVCIAIALYSFFYNAILSQFDTITLQYLHQHTQYYSRIRLWGSVGFIVAVVCLGWFFDNYPTAFLIPISCVLLLLLALDSFLLQEPAQLSTPAINKHWRGQLKHPVVIAFLFAAFLLQFSFSAYYGFFSVYLQSYGYNRQMIGLLWSIGVIAEIVLFFSMHKVIQRYRVSHIFCLSLALTCLRWWVIACGVEHLWLLLIAQVLHAFSFGAAHAASIELIRRFFPAQMNGQGNALYSALTFGAGGALGALVSGYLWALAPELIFIVGALVTAVATILVWYCVCQQTDDRLKV